MGNTSFVPYSHSRIPFSFCTSVEEVPYTEVKVNHLDIGPEKEMRNVVPCLLDALIHQPGDQTTYISPSLPVVSKNTGLEADEGTRLVRLGVGVKKLFLMTIYT